MKAPNKNIKVFMTGAGAPAGVGIIRSLQAAGFEVYGGDMDEEASGRFFLHENFRQLPPANHENFIFSILSICREEHIDVLLPVVTRELLSLAMHIEEFENIGTKVIVSGAESLKLSNSKCRLYDLLFERGIELPKYKNITRADELLSAIEFIGYPDKPFCIKPGISNGSRGVRIVDSSIDKHSLFFTQKPSSLYTKLSDIQEVLEIGMPEMLVSEVLPGEEITIDCLISNGNPILILPRRRLKINNGISVKGEFFYDGELIAYTTKILMAIEADGPIGIQMKKDLDGHYRVLEINPRIQGTSVSAAALGINLPEIIIRSALQLPVYIPEASMLPWGSKFVRFYDEVFF